MHSASPVIMDISMPRPAMPRSRLWRRDSVHILVAPRSLSGWDDKWQRWQHPLTCPASCLQVDPSVTFDQVGGMQHHIRALKEMIFLPLVYPELFERFHISPPRGVLFYGPPGEL